MQIVCRSCGYKWDYKGLGNRISCSKCKTSITLHHHDVATETIPVVPTDFKFPYKLWKDARFTQRMQNLPSLGEDYITLKTDINGNLSL